MDKEVNNKLQALFDDYTQNLPAKINQIEQAWLEQINQFNQKKFQDFHRHVHSLCGSAGTYGYTELGKAARTLEIYIKNLLDNNQITKNEQNNITELLLHLKETLQLPPSKKELFTFNSETKITENKIIYLLEQDEALVKQLTISLTQTGYITEVLSNLKELETKIIQNYPIALLIDTQFLTGEEDQIWISNFLKKQNIPIQLFCILPNNDILPRLMAIRAGCSAFFQKPLDIFNVLQVINQKCNIVTHIPYRILIIDDSELLGEYYALILNQAGMISDLCTNPLNIFKALEQFRPDLILMDIYMPECTGLELAAILRIENQYNKIPIIFLSTEHDKRKQLTALSIGGDDFLTKPISPAYLISAVRTRSQRAGVLNYYMSTDSLTGLLNHVSFLKRSELELNYAKQHQLPVSLVMIDIDHFKKVNDKYGHPFGDVVLKELATFLTLHLRRQDIVGRYGGEEFAIFLHSANAKQTKKIMDKLREEFSQYHFENMQNFSATFSVGITENKKDSSITTMVHQADEALYEAKSLGRNRVVIFDEFATHNVNNKNN